MAASGKSAGQIHTDGRGLEGDAITLIGAIMPVHLLVTPAIPGGAK